MRVYLAGATGVIGVRLLPLLVEAGHVVAGMTRSRPQLVEAFGAEPVVCDVYDAAAVRDAVKRFAPDLVLHQLTDLPSNAAHLEAARDANRRIRTVGTRNLLDATAEAKTVAQSTAFPAATDEHEQMVLDAGGVILRYGYFYGPGTWYDDGDLPPRPRIHVEDAARRTVDALHAAPGTVLEIAAP